MTAVESSGKSAMRSEMVRRGGEGARITATGSLLLSTAISAPADRHRRVQPRAYRSLTMHLMDVTDIGPAFEHQRRQGVTDM
jgi:hypothetical protein